MLLVEAVVEIFSRVIAEQTKGTKLERLELSSAKQVTKLHLMLEFLFIDIGLGNR